MSVRTSLQFHVVTDETRVVRRGIRQQLQYLRRNLKHIEGSAEAPAGLIRDRRRSAIST